MSKMGQEGTVITHKHDRVLTETSKTETTTHHDDRRAEVIGVRVERSTVEEGLQNWVEEVRLTREVLGCEGIGR